MIKLNKKQTIALDYLEDNTTKELIFGGGAGGSKSFLGCYWILKSCLKYGGIRALIGRAHLKTLKETTLNTLFEVCKLQGIKKDVHFVYNGQSNTIRFFNGSEILLKDLSYYPSDPNYDELGSLELSLAFIDEVNQIPSIAWQIVKSRIRFKLDDYNLIPKILGSCNPSKNYIYTDFYKPNKEGTLPIHKKFIQALVTDNPNISKHYIDNLNSLPKAQRDRLLLGLWESSDDNQLCTQDNIVSIFDNIWVGNNLKEIKYYITGDIARMGSDLAVIGVWKGLRLIKVITYQKSDFNLLNHTITSLKNEYKVPNSNIILDEDGVGGFLVDSLKCVGFVNNSSPLENGNYQNLKTQCYYKLSDYINKNEIYIEDGVLSEDLKEKLIEELEQIKSLPSDDNKLKLISKSEVKSNIGRSPDISDMLMMRMYFEVKKKNNVYVL